MTLQSTRFNPGSLQLVPIRYGKQPKKLAALMAYSTTYKLLVHLISERSVLYHFQARCKSYLVIVFRISAESVVALCREKDRERAELADDLTSHEAVERLLQRLLLIEDTLNKFPGLKQRSGRIAGPRQE